MRTKQVKWISFLAAMMLLFSAAPVFAAEGEGTGAPERAYEIGLKVLKDGTEEVSAADEYVQKPIKVTVENGVGYAEITLLKSSWITAFKVEQAGELVEPAIVAEDETADTRTVKFPVDSKLPKLNAYFAVEVAAMNYKGEYQVQLQFETPGRPGTGQEEGEAPAGEENGEEPSGQEPGEDYEGHTYEVAFAVLKDGTDEQSSLGNYASKTGQLYAREGSFYLAFTLYSSSLIPSFQYEVNGEFVDANVLAEDEEADLRVVEIAVANVKAKQNVALEVNAGPYGVMKHQAQILIDTTGMPGEPSEEEGEPAEPVFTDIEGHWAKAAIAEAVSLGIVQGYEDQTFNPDGLISRAQLAVILTNAFGLDGTVVTAEFADQASIPAYATIAVAQVQANGLLLGYADGTFQPGANVSRAQLAVVIARAAGLELADEADLAFADAQDIPAWAQPSVAAAVEAGLIAGRGNNLFVPGGFATRAEVVTLVLKVLQAQ